MLLRFPSAELFVEVARTPQALAQGLRGRAFLPEDSGMLFDMQRSDSWPFTMGGVTLPLDMIFLDESREVVGIISAATPNTDGPYVIRQPSRWVVEANGGWADRHGINIGDMVSFG
jgi:uncharacterized protein